MQTSRENLHDQVGASHAIVPNPHECGSQMLHFPTSMMRDMEKYAAKLERSVSWCVRMAWSIACGDLADGHGHEKVQGHRMLKGRKEPMRIELPLSTWLHIALEAERLDRSRSWMLQRTWMMARPRFLTALR
jgi:uncharacterized small protein (TIGR04563 family)